MGLYTVLAILFLVLMNREIAHGPGEEHQAAINAGNPITLA
jgi:cytochrome bd-type quinol oxidase subunit 1